jgi:hypothetical protein
MNLGEALLAMHAVKKKSPPKAEPGRARPDYRARVKTITWQEQIMAELATGPKTLIDMLGRFDCSRTTLRDNLKQLCGLNKINRYEQPNFDGLQYLYCLPKNNPKNRKNEE